MDNIIIDFEEAEKYPPFTAVPPRLKGKLLSELGGPGSGNHGHRGRPGQVGGSSKGGPKYRKIPKRAISDSTKYAVMTVTKDSFRESEAILKIDDDDPEIISIEVDDRDDSTRNLQIIATTERGYEFSVGGRRYTAGGEYKPNTREVIVYQADQLDPKQMGGILSHELQHDTYEEWKMMSSRQNSEIFKQNKKGKKKRITDELGNILTEENKKKYWAYQLYNDFFEDRAGSLIESDGVSSYSRAYWKQYESNRYGSSFEQAVNETLAEINRIRLGYGYEQEGDMKPGEINSDWKELYSRMRNNGEY